MGGVFYENYGKDYTIKMKTNTILQGDSLEVLKTFDDDSK